MGCNGVSLGGGGSSTGMLWYCVRMEPTPRWIMQERPQIPEVASSLLATRLSFFFSDW